MKFCWTFKVSDSTQDQGLHFLGFVGYHDVLFACFLGSVKPEKVSALGIGYFLFMLATIRTTKGIS